MFGNIGQIASLLKNAGQIKENMKGVQERLKAARFVGDAGGGQVRATVDGKGELVRVQLEPTLVSGGDREMIEELVVAAVNSAILQSRAGAQKEIEAAAGGINLQGMFDMLGK